ncbi:MAG TPA: glycosyltransferase 87 family protein, partial [Micromonosporaceae bacterium]|nr:glycosyltransferase 87 family protein [Micromonosporaceae bacterium]
MDRWWRAADRAGGGRWLDLTLYAIGALFAGLTAATSTLVPHRAWGAVAAGGYAAAAALSPFCRGTRARALLTGAAWAATTLLPLLLQAVQRAGGRSDRAQEEVVVVEQAGRRLLDSGTPYLSQDAIAVLPPVDWLLAYLPYQPGMALFGLPRALAADAAWWTDARLWFALVTAGALALAARVLLTAPAGATGTAGAIGYRADPDAVLRGVQAATVLPVCALTLATGGDDLPVLALCMLALALCARERFGAAGVAAGLAGALKLFAWPVILVLLALALTAGRRPLARLAAGAVGLPVLALLPALLADAGALLDNVVRFPLGDALVTSPAQSPFPGYLIAQYLPGG